MALLDVNALVALAWDSHVHHDAVRAWFAASSADGWATCPVTESGFVRVSSNPKVLPSFIAVEAARGVLRALRDIRAHRFPVNDVSLTDPDAPALVGHRQVSDAQLPTLARRNRISLVTFDTAIAALAGGHDVELLAAGAGQASYWAFGDRPLRACRAAGHRSFTARLRTGHIAGRPARDVPCQANQVD